MRDKYTGTSMEVYFSCMNRYRPYTGKDIYGCDASLLLVLVPVMSESYVSPESQYPWFLALQINDIIEKSIEYHIPLNISIPSLSLKSYFLNTEFCSECRGK